MFGDLHVFWLAWQVWSDLKGGKVDAETISKLAALLIPVLVPFLIAGIKALIPKLPTWILPILAPILGALSAAVSGVADPGTGAVLGLAGIGVREVADQTRKAAKQAPK